MSLQIRAIASGPLQTVAYLLIDSRSHEATLIDTPPDLASKLDRELTKRGARLTQIVITHGHWDHILGAHDVVGAHSVPILAHENVRSRLESPEPNAGPSPMTPVKLDQSLAEGDDVTVGQHTFRVMYMPGHDDGHIILVNEADGVVMGGDVLFPDGHGRTDLPGSDQATMNATLKRFLDLPESLEVFPGHGNATTIKREARWIRQIP